MPTIHVNTDVMRQLGNIFVQFNEVIRTQFEPQIVGTMQQLEGDWQGVSRQRYDQTYQDWRTNCDRIIQSGEDLGRHLQNTAQNIEQADRS